MAFNRTGSNNVSTTSYANTYDLMNLIGDFGRKALSVFESTTAIGPDADYLPDDLIEALAKVAKEIGYDYDPAKTFTFTYVLRKSGSAFLEGPGLYAYGNEPAIKWGTDIVLIDSDCSLFQDWRYTMPSMDTQNIERPPLLIFKPKQFNFPLPVNLVYLEELALKRDRISALGKVDTFGDLVPYLQSGVPLLSCVDAMEEGKTYTIDALIALVDRKDGNGQFGILTGVDHQDGKPIQVYAPDPIDFWANENNFPSIVERQGYTIHRLEDGVSVAQFKLGRPYTKLVELVPNWKDDGVLPAKFEVIGYEVDDSGKFGPKAVLTVIGKEGEELLVNGNAAINNSLIDSGAVISPNEPAELYIEQVTIQRNDKIKVRTRLVLHSDKSDPMFLRLQKLASSANRVAPAL